MTPSWSTRGSKPWVSKNPAQSSHVKLTVDQKPVTCPRNSLSRFWIPRSRSFVDLMSRTAEPSEKNGMMP